eukprot:SAG25_NODE_1320_length_3292_cov_7.643909_2_plen_60_part_00
MYDTYLSRCHSPCKSINRSPMFGCNGSCYVFVLVNGCHKPHPIMETYYVVMRFISSIAV